MDTFELKDEEIFAIGTWNGDRYDPSDLDKMVAAYNETSSIYQPKIKLTHEHPKGWPAVGWMENVRRQGNKIIADLKGIPKKVFDAIKAGGYRSKSAEILWNVVVDGKKHPYFLKAVALLGVDMKGVESISDMMASLYSSDGGEARAYKSEAPEGESKTYDLEKKEDTDMDRIAELTQDLATANAKLTASEENVKKFSKEIEDLKAKVADAEKRAEGAEGKAKEYAAKEVDARVNQVVDKLITDKKLAPAQKEKAYNLLRAVADTGAEKKYKLGDKEASLEEIAVDLLGSAGVDLNDGTKSFAGKRQNNDKVDGDDAGDVNEVLAKKAKEYQAAHKDVSFTDALKAVSREEGIDPSLRK